MLSRSHKRSNYSFLIIPLTALTIGPGLHDVNGFPKLAAVVVGTFVLTMLYPENLKIKSKIVLIPWLIVASYGILQLINLNDLNSFLLGTYMRNGGFIAIISFAVLLTIVSNLELGKINDFRLMVTISIYGLIIYWVLDFFELLPYETKLTYQGALTLTLTNPNFTCAYLGIVISGLCLMLIFKHKYFFSNILILVVSLFLLFATQSLQGWLIVGVNLTIILIYFREKSYRLFNKYKKMIFFISSSVIVAIIFNLANISNWFITNASVKQRLSYWNLSLDIWRHHPIIGIGLDNLRNFTTIYRSEELVRQEGMFTAPDRSHNVILDQLVNGGVVTASLWLIFIFLVTRLAIKNVILVKHSETTSNLLFVSLCWFGYLVQSFISVDHLALTIIGYISAGFIIGSSVKGYSEKNVKTVLFMNIKLVRTLGASIFMILILYGIQIFKFEYNAYQFLINNSSLALKNVYDSKVIVAQTLEDVAVKVSQAKDFENAYLLALKLIEHDPTSHQAYYMRAVYYESKNDLTQAKQDMLKALELDRYNSVYLLGMSVLEYNTGQFINSRKYLEDTIKINPNQVGIDLVKNLLDKKS